MKQFLEWFLFVEIKILMIFDQFLFNKFKAKINLFFFDVIVDGRTLVHTVHW